ncbi:Lin1244/Lin1753 domain-containing protein [Lacticaseibacillus parakribbianus]|uniref:Lin1244/Lin1753 domain-containing protein n=1 Tax=Lacticaseibacillus parakribbianus TaxID=2970927 RepID=UPI0021CB8DA6|nr:Lin1244/Lin1753 domain-containing protein [Lacticaseibacillus parakribbianus]
MARPIKKGLDYYPRDTDFVHKLAVRKIMKANGPASVAVVDCIEGYIYSERGYYMSYDEDARFLIADDVGVKELFVDEVVQKAVQVGYFDAGMFAGQNILTSTDIQKRYKSAAAQKKDSSIEPEYDLMQDECKDDNEVSNPVNYLETRVSKADNPQSKVKESKTNKSKPNDSLSGGHAHEELAFDRWQSVWGFPNAVAQQDLVDWVSEFGDELVTWVIDYAARRAVQAKAADKYLDRVLTQYREQGIKTVEQAEAEAKAHEQTAKANAPRQQRFGKPARQETAPEWLQPGYKAPEVPFTDDQKASLKARLDELKELEASKNG